MNISEAIGQEAAFLGTSILLGAILFLLYDVLRIFRRILPHGTYMIGLEDFIYWLICTAAVFVLIYRENDGMVRGFAFGGLLIGTLLYYLTLSRFIVKVNVFVLSGIGRIGAKIAGTLLGPFAKAWKKLRGFLRKQLKKIWRAVKISLRKH